VLQWRLPTRLQGRPYPYLAALFSVLFYYGKNPNEATITSLVFVIAVVFLICFLLFAILGLVIKNKDRRSFLAFIILIPLLNYGELWDVAEAHFSSQIMGSHLFPLSMAVMVVMGIIAALVPKYFSPRLSQILTVAMLSLLASGMISIVQSLHQAKQQEDSLVIKPLSPGQLKPDIYYLIFDEYSGPVALQKLYGYDDSGLLNNLKSQGFYVADQSTSNYYGSLNSISSTLNLQYLNVLAARAGATNTNQQLLRNLLENNRLILELQSVGYEYYHLGSWWGPTQGNQNSVRAYYSDVPLGYPPFLFHYLSETTILSPIIQRFFPSFDRKIVGEQMNSLQEVAAIRTAPKLVFAHFLIPHGPYVYNAQCQPLLNSVSDGDAGTANAAAVYVYLDQLTCTNQIIEKTVQNLKGVAPKDSIIVVQSDEGEELSYPNPVSTSSSPQSFLSKFPILNAVYFPDQNYAQLSPTITPVNTFRIILSQYFGADFPLLPDQNRIIAPEGPIIVTDEVRQAM